MISSPLKISVCREPVNGSLQKTVIWSGGSLSQMLQIYSTVWSCFTKFYLRPFIWGNSPSAEIIFNFLTLEGIQFNVRDPAVLFWVIVGDDGSDATSITFTEAAASDGKVEITAMLLHPIAETVFCREADGSICQYDLKSGAELLLNWVLHI